MTIYGEGTGSRSTFYLATRVRQSLQHGCIGYLSYVVDTRVDEKMSISITDVPVV